MLNWFKFHFPHMSSAPKLKNVVFDQDLPILDRAQFEMLVMGENVSEGLELAREIFSIFAEESAAKLAELDSVCASNDLARMRYIVHFIAGSAGNLGLARLCGFYRGIEQALDHQQIDSILDFAEPIRAEYEVAHTAYEQELLG